MRGTPKLTSSLTGSKRYISPTPTDIDGLDTISFSAGANGLAERIRDACETHVWHHAQNRRTWVQAVQPTSVHKQMCLERPVGLARDITDQAHPCRPEHIPSKAVRYEQSVPNTSAARNIVEEEDRTKSQHTAILGSETILLEHP